ncbi:hypothetical protein T190115A13A_160003 [Tenacibaculum sp. 190524A02b]|uniref:Uncharacterized protein n=1 Tax=Tenacibaculum vairaonense TaxID=3137860 RepID=A0ABM9PIL5_9FLAO
MITFENFFLNTKALFKACKKPKREPDYVSNSGSMYWYGENRLGQYVIRCSDHWVIVSNPQKKEVYNDCFSIASCSWNLRQSKKENKRYKSGKAYLSEFAINKKAS